MTVLKKKVSFMTPEHLDATHFFRLDLLDFTSHSGLRVVYVYRYLINIFYLYVVCQINPSVCLFGKTRAFTPSVVDRLLKKTDGFVNMSGLFRTEYVMYISIKYWARVAGIWVR